jgi:cysteinyl-tRNA synthetase
VDPAVLAKEKAQKAAEEARKAEAKAAAARKAAEKEAKARVPPAEYFKQQVEEGGTPKFAAFDAEGFPTLDAGGEALSKGQVKRLQKEWEAHRKLHEKVVGGGGGGGDK